TEPIELFERSGALFDALFGSGFYASADTEADQDLAERHDVYLGPTGARALLLASCFVAGEPCAVVSCVHPHPRRWSPAEITQLRHCASELALSITRSRGRSILSPPPA